MRALTSSASRAGSAAPEGGFVSLSHHSDRMRASTSGAPRAGSTGPFEYPGSIESGVSALPSWWTTLFCSCSIVCARKPVLKPASRVSGRDRPAPHGQPQGWPFLCPHERATSNVRDLSLGGLGHDRGRAAPRQRRSAMLQCVVEVTQSPIAMAAVAFAIVLSAIAGVITRVLPVVSDKAARRVAKMNRSRRK